MAFDPSNGSPNRMAALSLIGPSGIGAPGQTPSMGQPSPALPPSEAGGGGGTVASSLARAVSETINNKFAQEDQMAWKSAFATLEQAIKQVTGSSGLQPQGPQGPQGLQPQGGLPPTASPGLPGQL